MTMAATMISGITYRHSKRALNGKRGGNPGTYPCLYRGGMTCKDTRRLRLPACLSSRLLALPLPRVLQVGGDWYTSRKFRYP